MKEKAKILQEAWTNTKGEIDFFQELIDELNKLGYHLTEIKKESTD